MLTLVILLSLISISSIVLNVIFWKAAERHLAMNEIYEKWISDWRQQVFKTWAHMKLLDDKQMFEKDDEVGVVFQDLVELIRSLNERTEESTEEDNQE